MADNKQQQVNSVRIYDPRWHTAEGISVGTPVSQLQARFGTFQFFGFNWDYGGVIFEQSPKLKQYVQTLRLGLTLGLPRGSCQQMTPDYQAVIGDQKVSSNDRAVKRLKAQVTSMTVALD